MNKYFVLIIFAVIVAFGLWKWSFSKSSSIEEVAHDSAPAPVNPQATNPPEERMPPVRQAAGVLPTTQILDLTKDPQGENFVREHAKNLWQVDPDSLEFEKKDNGGRIKLSYIQKFNGLPIFGARLSLFVEGQQLNRTQNELSFLKEVDGEFNLSAAQAEDRLKKLEWDIRAPAEPLFYPVMDKLRPAYRVTVTRGETSNDLIVDAVDGRTIRTIPRTHY